MKSEVIFFFLCFVEFYQFHLKKKETEGWSDNLNSTCDDLVARLDNLYNISPDFYLFDDDVFPRLTFNSIDGTTNTTNTWTSNFFV